MLASPPPGPKAEPCCTRKQAGYGVVSLVVLGGYLAALIYVPVLDNAWFIGSGLFIFSLLLLQAFPCLQSSLADVAREPDWLDKVENDRIAAPVFYAMHQVIVAMVITTVFYNLCISVGGWAGALPHFEEWSLRDFVRNLAEAGGLAWTLHEVTSFVALTLAKKWSHRKRGRLVRRHIGPTSPYATISESASTPSFPTLVPQQ